MTTVAELIQNTAADIESGDIYDLQNGLNRIAQIPRQQLQANQTAVTLPIQQLTQAVERNIRANQSQVNDIDKLNKNISKITNNLPETIKKQIRPVLTNISNDIKQNQQINKIQQAINEKTKQIQKQIQVSGSKLQSFDPSTFRINSNVSKLSPIEQSILEYKPILDLPIPQITRPGQLPSTMKLLSQYARVRGRIPVSAVTNQGGSCYVGVRQVQIGNMKQLVPYEKNQIKKSSVPSISTQLQYYANKTINSWNRYIGDQSQFVGYFSKINSAQKRQQYVQKQFNALNLETFAAQAIATLVHYYVYLPFRRALFKSNLGQKAELSFQFFLQKYQILGLDENPMLLGLFEAKKLVTMIFNTKGLVPTLFLAQLKPIIKNNDTSLLKNEGQKLFKYVETKSSEANLYMIQNGLDEDTISGVLGSGDWSSVKKKKFITSSGLVNPQINQIAKNVIKNSKKKQQKVKELLISWNNEEIICHDYIWGWGRK